MLEPDSEPIPEDFYYFSDHSMSVFQNPVGLTFVFDGKTVVRSESAMRYAACDMYETCAIYYDEANTLYFVNKNGYTKVRENVRNAVMSFDGRYIAFICSDNSSSEILIKYDTDKNTSVVIEKSSYFSDDSDLILSHNGESLVYSKYYGNLDVSETYLSTAENQGECLDSVQTVLTVSNDGKCILWHNEDGNYYLMRDGKSENLGKVSPETIKANIDSNEFIYSVQGKGSYLINENNEPFKISELFFNHIYMPTHAIKGDGLIFAVNKFTDKLFEASLNSESPYSAVYLDKNAESTVLQNLSVIKDNYVSYNISTIYFVKNGTVFKSSTKSPEDKTVIAQNVISESLTLTRDGKYLYYIDYDGTLYRIGNGVIKSIATDIETITLGNDGYLYFFDDNNDIYFIKGASSPKKVATSAIDGDISIVKSNRTPFVLCNNCLYSFKGEEIKLLSDDVISLYGETTPSGDISDQLPKDNE